MTETHDPHQLPDELAESRSAVELALPTGAAGPRRRRGRPAGNGATEEGVRGHTLKRYELSGADRTTVGHLRRILGQRHVPDSAITTLDSGVLTIEWDD